MAVAEAAVVGVRSERDRRVGHVAQLGQVKHLHAVPGGLGDDEGVVGIDLDVAPQGGDRVGRQVAEVDRVVGVGDVDEGGARRAAEQGVFLAVQRVGPTPDVVHLAAADFAGREVAHEVDLIAGVDAGKSVHTGRGRLVGRGVADPIAVGIGGAIAIADPEGVHLADAIVHVVTDAVVVGIGRTVAAAHAEGVDLAAVAVTIASRDVVAATVVDRARSAAHAAGIEIGAGAVVGVGVRVVVAGRGVGATGDGGGLHTEGGHIRIGEAPPGSHDLVVDREVVAAIAVGAADAVPVGVVHGEGVAPVAELFGSSVARVVSIARAGHHRGAVGVGQRPAGF